MIPFEGIYKPVTSFFHTGPQIIEALLNAQKKASNQLAPVITKIINVTGDPVKDAEQIARYVNQNFTYQRDSMYNQKIQFPSALFYTKKGDCKSFSLFVCGALLSLGYGAGFRFCNYKPGQLTHVYNFVLGVDKKKYTFDSCLRSLQESPRYIDKVDSMVTYLSEPSCISQTYLDGPKRAERRRNRRANREEAGRGFGRKRIALAPVRGAFLLLVKLNVRGAAAKLNQARAKNLAEYRKFWLKLGGDPARLNTAVDKGKNRKSLFIKDSKVPAVNGQYIGEVATGTVAAIAAAAPILVALPKFLKAIGITPGKDIEEGADDAKANGAENLGDFEATDAESGEAKEYTQQSRPSRPSPKAAGGASTTTKFNASPFIIGGAALVAVLVLPKLLKR